ncbi:uncharacterized protein RJT20DRAFT_60531 [Scheffersomyces xylosifermentans]|uniref:uncharacterized protein n=1 Tax=Scheffersomyces xylosifermentans TaxID=1304137 RepID=UPI00315D6C82
MAGNGNDKDQLDSDIEYVEPLIRSDILDLATQRMFIVSLFILIQSWKIYDVILLKSDVLTSYSLSPLNNFSFVLKYAIIDGLFLWLLPVLNIQYLIFSPLKTLGLALLLNGLTFFLVSSFTFPLLSGLFSPFLKIVFQNKELTIVGDSIDKNSVIDIDAHFKGKFTIQYLPDSSAKMNPFHFDQTCLDTSVHQILEMPIEFNTTTDIGRLKIQHTTVNNEVRDIDYTGNALRKLLKRDYRFLSKYPEYNRNDDRVFYIQFPISESGSYKIKSVTDVKGISIRTYKSEFLISDCPRAQFLYPPNFDASKNYKCLPSKPDDNTLHLPLLEVFGVSPATIQVVNHLNGKFYKSFNITIGEESEAKKGGKDLTWLRANTITRNSLEQEISRHPDLISNAQEGILEFQLTEVTDFLSNSKKYNPLSKDKDVRFSYELKKAPTLFLEDKKPDTELLVDGSKVLRIGGADTLKESDFPITCDVLYTNQQDPSLSSKTSKTFHRLSDLLQGVEVSQPGTYQLANASTRFCDCEILKKDIKISLAQPPSVDIAATPITDKCLGTVGYNFDLKFVGKAPFHIQYHVYQNQSNGILRPVHSERGTTARVLKSFENKHSFTFRPPAEGNYVIVFNNIKDVNYYPRPVVLDEQKYTYSTYFKKTSKVTFFKNESPHHKSISTCFGQTATIPLYFEGNGPFSFDYDFIDTQTGKKLQNTVKVKDVFSYEIRTPESLKGKYSIKLSGVTDKSACGVIQDERESFTINSRSDIPEVQIDNSTAHFRIVEGDSVEIPLQYKTSVGKSRSDKVEYRHIDLVDKSKQTTKVIQGGQSLRVTQSGVYSLLTYENGGCPGKVINRERTITVSYYDRPRLSVSSENELKQHSDESSLHLKSLCQNRTNPVRVSLEGKPPFVIDYEIKLPSGRVESRSMNVEKKELNIKLPTSTNGRYEHRFKGIYDSLYTKDKARHVVQKLPNILYDVNQLPNLKFDRSNQVSQICENRIKPGQKLIKIPLQLTGKFPFRINATLKHESTGKSEILLFEEVKEPFVQLYGDKDMKVGDHILTINHVADGNGCSRNGFSPSNNYIIAVTEVPNIFKQIPSKRDYCVGDHIAYNLTGVPPFTVFYKFNEKSQKAQVPFNFQRLASRPGVLSIEAIQDSSASSCLVNVTSVAEKDNELRIHVHDLPSVEVNKGDYIVEDLHEGDQTEITFRFFGEPPFSLTYVRTTEAHEKKNKKAGKSIEIVETHSIKDIWEFEHTVLASLEGTYEAIEVSDAHCTARRKLQ